MNVSYEVERWLEEMNAVVAHAKLIGGEGGGYSCRTLLIGLLDERHYFQSHLCFSSDIQSYKSQREVLDKYDEAISYVRAGLRKHNSQPLTFYYVDVETGDQQMRLKKDYLEALDSAVREQIGDPSDESSDSEVADESC